MRAERFGSYSIAATFAGHAVLRALEVDHAVAALVAAALVAHRQAAVVVAAALLRQLLGERLLRLRLRDLLERRDRHEAAARRRRLELANGHQTCAPSKISIVSPSRSCTIAFFQPGRMPFVSPRRFGFGCTLRTFTPSTCTLKSSSTAWRTCVRCASGWMRKTYLPSLDQAVALLRHDGREQNLVRMQRHLRRPPLHVAERVLADEHRARPDDLRHLELGRQRDERLARGCGTT